jgi:uncharacterized RDD family membrane protein YckC
MLPEPHSFFIRGEDGQEYGPADLDELREWVKENRAGLGTEVRIDEPNAPWLPWQNYPELIALLAEVHVTGPVPGVPGLVIAPLGRRILAFAGDLILAAIPTMIIWYAVVMLCFPDWVVKDVVAFNQFLSDAAAGNQHAFTPPEVPQRLIVVSELLRDTIIAFYFAGFIVAHGQTPAKAMLGLRVVDRFGRKPPPLAGFLRALVMIFSMSLFFLPMAYAFFDPQRRALHDFIVGTYVVEA